MNTGPRINDYIRASKVRLIDSEGEFLGIVSLEEAREEAARRGLDLVEVAADARPPVCKILDYGKLRFEERKKKALMKKKQKSLDTKELQFRLKIGDHDYQVKLRQAENFLRQGHRLRVVVRFKGREIGHQNMGVDLVNKILADLSALGKPEAVTKSEGRRMLVVVVPLAKKAGQQEKKPSSSPEKPAPPQVAPEKAGSEKPSPEVSSGGPSSEASPSADAPASKP
ncbi:translation initiation factor IF-3 [Candidatus Hepatobacter penaei]|uniref:translation initiation factor IF-3 n=1 Tax=Candidatus Hepatobacter penaei TaxID=1274402 RepID=UPI0006983ADB|nr:translation initiation factor IF-3 [Candidatus Hepatobacter penaei]TGW15185.1 translation initiation factor IF-3 [bacterium NHP-B]